MYGVRAQSQCRLSNVGSRYYFAILHFVIFFSISFFFEVLVCFFDPCVCLFSHVLLVL